MKPIIKYVNENNLHPCVEYKDKVSNMLRTYYDENEQQYIQDEQDSQENEFNPGESNESDISKSTKPRSASGSMEVQYSEYMHNTHPDTQKLRGSPFIKMHVHGIGVDAIPDTGSERTICSAEQAKKLFGNNLERLLEPTSLALRSATGHKLRIMGLIMIPMQIGQSLINHKCVVINDSQLDFIIGNDLMIDRASLVKGRTFEVNKSDNGIRSTVPIQYCNPVIGLMMTNSITIPPKDTVTVKAVVCLRPENIRHYIGHTFLIQETQSDSELHDVIDSISDLTSEGRIDICLGNMTQEDIEIYAGEIVGQAEIIFPDDKLPGYLYYSDLSENESKVNFVSCHDKMEDEIENESRPHSTSQPGKNGESLSENESRQNNNNSRHNKAKRDLSESELRRYNVQYRSKANKDGYCNESKPYNNTSYSGRNSRGWVL